MKNLDNLVKTTGIPHHAHSLICTYFDNWPHDTTQELYKAMGGLCSQYWYHELKRILNAKIHFTDEFRAIPYMDYYTTKYPTNNCMNIAEISPEDRTHLLRAFTTQLGMHWNIFPYTLHHFT
jgi:hypothetical protein